MKKPQNLYNETYYQYTYKLFLHNSLTDKQSVINYNNWLKSDNNEFLFSFKEELFNLLMSEFPYYEPLDNLFLLTVSDSDIYANDLSDNRNFFKHVPIERIGRYDNLQLRLEWLVIEREEKKLKEFIESFIPLYIEEINKKNSNMFFIENVDYIRGSDMPNYIKESIFFRTFLIKRDKDLESLINSMMINIKEENLIGGLKNYY